MNRTNRERTIDLGIVVLAAALSVVVAKVQSQGLQLYPQLSSGARLFGWLDGVLPWPVGGTPGGQVAAVLACASLCWRRRWPVPVAGTVVAAGMFSPTVVAVIVALFTVAVLRPVRTTAWVTVWAVVPALVSLPLRPYDWISGVSAVLIGCTLMGAAVGWGRLVRALHERAETAEAEAALRARQAQHRAREEIAREMHDVLAHRLSLLSVHAGALEFNPAAQPSEVGRAAGVIRENAHQALEDLQLVLRVLRTPLHDPASEPPQPTLGGVQQLVAESRAAGMRIELELGIEAPDNVPGLTGRTGYRIVQEALTNARKHAPNALVRIAVRGGPGKGLTVDVRNQARPHGAALAAAVPGGGQGLIGLVERAELAGGQLSHGLADGDHFVRAWLPWAA